MNTSRRIITDGPHNLRDLGGMISKDHRKVKEGILLRSDKLSSLSDRDKKILRSMNLCCAYDLRNAHERADRPDVVIPGCEYIPLPIFPDRVEGITHERDSELNGYIRFVEAMLKDRESAKNRMISSYRDFVRSEHCRAQFGFFLEDLLKRAGEAKECGQKRAFLWHCAGGKDRTGFASVLLEEIFGIPEEDIIDDYMLTNKYVDQTLPGISSHVSGAMEEYFGDRIEEIAEQIRGPVADMMLARREYIDAAYEEAERCYGSFSSFLTKGLELTLEKQEEMRRLFLERG